MKSILALDLGSIFGWATVVEEDLNADSKELVSAKEMKAARTLRMNRRCDPRVTAFWDWLHRQGDFDIVVFEDVQFSSYTAQVQLWSSLRACVWLAYADSCALLECVPVGTLKLWAAGSGAATKEAMASALIRRLPGRFTHPQGKHTKHELVWDSRTKKNLDDNAIDAILLSMWASNYLGNYEQQ